MDWKADERGTASSRNCSYTNKWLHLQGASKSSRKLRRWLSRLKLLSRTAAIAAIFFVQVQSIFLMKQQLLWAFQAVLTNLFPPLASAKLPFQVLNYSIIVQMNLKRSNVVSVCKVPLSSLRNFQPLFELQIQELTTHAAT